MILTCDECQTRYLVASRSIGADGRRVRCSNCGYEWFQEPEEVVHSLPPQQEVEPIPESVKPVPEGSEVPVLFEPMGDNPEQAADSEPGRAVAYAAAVAVFLAIIGGFAAAHDRISKIWPASVAFYDLVGIHTPLMGEELIFDKLTAIAQRNEAGVMMLNVTGMILNLESRDAAVPFIQASLIDEEGEVLDSWLIEPDHKTIPAEGEMPFQTTYPDVSQKVKEVNIRFIIGADLPEDAKITGDKADVTFTEEIPAEHKETETPDAPSHEEEHAAEPPT